MQASHYRKSNWLGASATVLWNPLLNSHRGRRLDINSDLLLGDMGFLYQPTLARRFPNGFAVYFSDTATQLSLPLSFIQDWTCSRFDGSVNFLSRISFTEVLPPTKSLHVYSCLGFCFSENLYEPRNFKTSPDSTGGEIDTTCWWEKLQSRYRGTWEFFPPSPHVIHRGSPLGAATAFTLSTGALGGVDSIPSSDMGMWHQWGDINRWGLWEVIKFMWSPGGRASVT